MVLRKELVGGSALAQAVHAAREASRGQAPTDERACILVATKEQMAALWITLERQPVTSCISRITETDGPLAGSITAIGIITTQRDLLRAHCPLLGDLKVFR